MRTLLTFTCLFLLTVLSAQETPNYQHLGMDVTVSDAPRGLEVGTEAPAFAGTDQHGESLELSALLEEGPVVLIFYRGQWCPVCSRYLSTFRDSLDLLTARGATVVAVTPETPENVAKTIEKTGAAFHILSDADGSILQAYDVAFRVTEPYVEMIATRLSADIAENNGRPEAELPVPATYIIGQDGRIVYRQFDPNYKNRASVKEMEEHLPRIKGKEK